MYGPARGGPWKTVEDVELVTLGWVHWHNNHRLHGYLDDLPPAEFEAAFYDADGATNPGQNSIARTSGRVGAVHQAISNLLGERISRSSIQ